MSNDSQRNSAFNAAASSKVHHARLEDIAQFTEKVNSELINSRDKLQQRYYELMALLEVIDINPCVVFKSVKIILVTFLCLIITSCSISNITEVPDISVIEQHHVFPQQFRTDFERIGINIDEFTLRIPKSLHQKIHSSGWNNKWQTYLRANSNPTKAQLLGQVKKMLREIGLTGRQEFFKYSQSSVQKTGYIIVKHSIWILDWLGGTSVGDVIIAFLSTVTATVLGWVGIKADSSTLIGVCILTIVISLVLSVS